MYRKTSGILVVAVSMIVGANPMEAQAPGAEAERAPRMLERAGGAMRGGPSIELIMRMRERLELTDDQIAALDALRRESVARRSAEAAEMAEMRSRLQAGQIRQSEMMAFTEERRDANRDRAAARREQVESVLDAEQIEALEQLQMRARAFQRGRASMRGDRSGRPGVAPRGNRPGVRSDVRGDMRRDMRRGMRAPRPGGDPLSRR